MELDSSYESTGAEHVGNLNWVGVVKSVIYTRNVSMKRCWLVQYFGLVVVGPSVGIS